MDLSGLCGCEPSFESHLAKHPRNALEFGSVMTVFMCGCHRRSGVVFACADVAVSHVAVSHVAVVLKYSSSPLSSWTRCSDVTDLGRRTFAVANEHQ
mgnify:CR=1 FL=1